jgi:hypothetical protein
MPQMSWSNGEGFGLRKSTQVIPFRKTGSVEILLFLGAWQSLFD